MFRPFSTASRDNERAAKSFQRWECHASTPVANARVLQIEVQLLLRISANEVCDFIDSSDFID